MSSPSSPSDSSPSPASPPLVWVRQGKSQHAAYLLNNRGQVRWASTESTEYVDMDTIEYQLTPRKRGGNTSRDDHEEIDGTGSGSSEKKRKSEPMHRADLLVAQSKDETQQPADESSDDEVEVLLTIKPPTPKISKGCDTAAEGFQPSFSLHDEGAACSVEGAAQADKQQLPERKASAVDESEASWNLDITLHASESQPKSMVRSADDRSDRAAFIDPSKMDSVSILPPTYTYRSSAYVQNLAEICFTILHDRRWRVGDTQSCLFAWERGDDMSAVKLLGGMYQPLESPARRPCTCLLCRDKKSGRSGEDSMRTSNSAVKTTSSDSILVASQTDAADIGQDDRAIHLFSRLYYRKGPWFRIDDVYNKYYAPKAKVRSDNESEEDDDECAEESEFDGSKSETASEKQFDFFRQSQSSKSNVSDKSTASNVTLTKKDVINEEIMRQHLAATAELLSDIARLHEMGLLRSFSDEEECGKTAGAVTRDGSGLLKADERQNILAKLGCKDEPEKRRRNSNSVDCDRRSMRPIENAIWKQMRQQKSISYGLTANRGPAGSKSLLPVRRHVDSELFDKLAASIVAKSSTVERIPARLLRSLVSDVKKGIVLSMSTVTDSTAGRSSNLSDSCFRLREGPLLVLRRCARLYLCATHGPGDMRGDGSNGWKSLRDFDVHSPALDIPLFKTVRPPGAHSFHQASYPALSHRFGLARYPFREACSFLVQEDEPESEANKSQQVVRAESPTKNSSGTKFVSEHVFPDAPAFTSWEASIELRAQVDYLIELNDMVRYQERRRLRESNELENEEPDEEADVCEISTKESVSVELTTDEPIDVDFLKLLTVNGRRAFMADLLSSVGDNTECHTEVEKSLSKLEESAPNSLSSRLSDCERIICVVSVVIMQILLDRNRTCTPDELNNKSSRPWLRHLCWEGVVACSLWDCIAVLERTGLYELASHAVEVLLFGTTRPEGWLLTSSADSSVATEWMSETMTCCRGFSFSELLVSRRTRGKLFERLLIDYTHLLRRQAKTESLNGKNKQKKTPKKKKREDTTPQATVRSISASILSKLASRAAMPFSAIRCLARRLKAPLVDTLEGTASLEQSELKLRLGNAASPEDEEQMQQKCYTDWTPPTDTAVANAMGSDEPALGRRCSFVGFEDDENSIVNTASLNVEQLAMEFYASGRLPSSNETDEILTEGGWVGWHDEGGHVRALFRILCSAAIFGMDAGCGGACDTELDVLEQRTIFLTPYQGAPHDLHVGFSAALTSNTDDAGTESNGLNIRGFYERRRNKINSYVHRLELLDSQELCDLVYDTIIDRLVHAGSASHTLRDASMLRDLQQIRTLSMLAAGLGGLQLAAIFRALVFDYRHYSGGLPDLLLARAYFESDEQIDGKQLELVDLGEWVGESFSAEAKIEAEESTRANLLLDKDDEFLGCSKMGDSATRSNSRWRRGSSFSSSRNQSMEISCEHLPAKLKLQHKGRKVRVQCMFVEVKSQNDRLDGRQEDWLNILDRVGNARVCKFGSKKKTNKK